MTFQPSPFQQAIYDWTDAHIDQPGALIVEAVAGSGKTTTIVHAADRIPTDHKAVFLAFNKSIATELGNKLPQHVESKTLNALGWALCRYRLQGASSQGNRITVSARLEVDRNKVRDIIVRSLPDEAQEYRAEIMSLIGKAKSHGLIPTGHPIPSGTYEATRDRWLKLMDRYDIDANGAGEDTMIEWVNLVLTRNLEDRRKFDFDDQLYMPVALDLPAWGYDWVIIDEAQDVSHVQRTLLRKFLKRNGRLIAVGDSRQAIYGFRGADSQSLDNIARVFKAEKLPLSITYRCPRKVVEIAQRIVPEIECSDNAEDGEVLYPSSWAIESFSGDDLIVCRTTAPLIELAYKCISEGRRVHVMGREIGTGLINVIKKAGGKSTRYLEELKPKLDRWAERQLQKAVDDEAKQAAIMDRVECLKVLMAGLETVSELIAAIETLFSDSNVGTTLATIHKAKGLEASRVFILNPDGLPSKWATQDWQMQQERNLEYVAVTRALETLVYLPLEIVE